MRVAIQGERGAYSEAAALEHFGADTAVLPCATFDAAFAAVEAGEVDAGLVPIENSLAGSIHRCYDLLLQHSLAIIGEHHLRVRHCLIAHPGVALPEIRKVISHPQALAQCERYLRGLAGVTTEVVYDTAGSVKIVRDQGDRALAGIASRRAAEVYAMEVVAEGIEDDPANFTRFLAIAKQPLIPNGDSKTSIVFAMRNAPGALFKAMSVFALRDIDLTKIESRPLVGKVWEYLFYVDFAGSTVDPVVTRALQNLGEFTSLLRVLGSYPRHRPQA
ncbi:MAG: prephenate dehydratase [Anaerolineales bacterium]|nr:prephenate dehydratase [Anaerolineales bacterium]